jgi:hypothetical protein
LTAVADEEVEDVAAGETGSAGNQGRTPVSHQRGTPLKAPLNGEKFPSPASVNDRKKR